MTLIIKGGTIVDERGSRRGDIAIVDDKIVEVAEQIDVSVADDVLDASGCVVGPGLVDLHTHLREPGREDAETILTGSRAAALGGYTAVVAMPNTEPRTDSLEVLGRVHRASAEALCHVANSAGITVGLAGGRLGPMRELAAAGVRIFTDDGFGVQSAGLMRQALEIAAELDLVIAPHCEDSTLSGGGHMHEGEVSREIGVAGAPCEAEEVMVMRDIALARMTGARVHFLHLSTAGSVAMIDAAKQQGLAVTAEATPHHFTLTDDELRSFDPTFKVNPPIRSAGHRDAVKAALQLGTIDAIATDHAPHTPDLKQLPLTEAPCGMLGLETALALAITELESPIEHVFALMSWQPARIAGLGDHGRSIEPGSPANITVVDTEAWWTVDPQRLASKSRNTPFAGRKLRGKVRHTIYNGEPVVRGGVAMR